MRDSSTFRNDRFRRRCLLSWAMVGAAAVCIAVSASAIDPNRMLSQYIRNFWETEKDFPGGSVYSIAQTTDGYLWIGTDKGLIRFDGLNFRPFDQANPSSLAIGPVQKLLADAQGNLWILLQSTKLLRYHDGSFDLIRGEAENGITAIGRGTDGSVLLSSLAMGTLKYNGEKFVSVSAERPLTTSRANAMSPDDLSTRLSWSTGLTPHRLAVPSAVTSIAETSDGKIWLGTQDKGLFYLSEGSVFAAKGLPNERINCLLPLQTPQLLIGTANGLARWNGAGLTSASVPPSLLHVEVLSMIQDQDSNIWVGTTRGLLRFKANDVSSFPVSAPAGPATVRALFEDREGDVWIGGPRGVERLRDSAFVTYSVVGLRSQSIGPLYVAPDGTTWFAPIEGGLRWLREGKGGAITAAGLTGDVVYSIAGSGNEVWLGRQRGGLTQIRDINGSFTTKTYTQADGLAQNSVYAVQKSRDGTIWAGTLSGGVSKLRDGHFTSYTTNNGLSSNTVSSIAEGSDGTMWFGTPSGLSVMSSGSWRTYTAGDGLSSQDVNCLLEDSTGVLWIGTADGLAFLSAGQIHVPRAVPDSLHEPIFGIAEDRGGSLWIATAGHVLQVKRTSLMAGALSDTDIREYGLADGLHGTEGVKRHQSVVADSRGQIWLSTNRGLSVVNPARPTVNTVPALVHIDAVLADGSPFDLRRPMRVSARQQRTTFRFAGLSLANPERVRYRYRLDGFDRGWSESVTTGEASYANLGAGSYKFRVMASNSDGLWNSSEATLRFEIEPVLWQTWWFRASCMALVVLLVWCAHRYRLHQVAKQFNIRLEERVSERTRIARELHDTLLQSFQGVLLRFQGASNILPTRPEEAKQRLDNAIDQVSRAIAEGRDAVQGLRTSTVVTNDLARTLRALAEELAADKTGENSTVFEVDVEGTPRELHPILRDEVYRIAGEALRNAFRHAQAQRIELEIRYDQHQVRLRIRDDGKGIDSRVLNGEGHAGHWGLAGMRERAKLVGGNLEVWSELDSGTEIELSIPASIAYARSIARRFWFSRKSTSVPS